MIPISKKDLLTSPATLDPTDCLLPKKVLSFRKIGTVRPEVFETVVNKLFEIIKH
jgi:hypothetical protein